MKKFTVFLLLLSITCFSQTIRVKPPCFTDQLRTQLATNNPQIQNIINQMDLELSNNANNSSLNPTTVTIPVVFYIVHDNQPVGTNANISDSQVNSQLTALNNYFNGYGLNFCLATKAGTTTINGINRINNTTLSNHTTASQTALENAGFAASNFQVDRSRYLRIYVVKSINGATSGILGYATFPNNSEFDGIVMKFNAVGDISGFPGGNYLSGYNQGKVLVHEIGHYLSLYHTFQESCSGMDSSTCGLQGDRICDTPPVNTPNFECLLGADSCLENPNFPDDIQNYMDYGDNYCQSSFTVGQKTRMLNALNLYRNNLITQDNQIFTGTCGSANLVSATFSASSYQTCTNSLISFTPISTNSGLTYSWDFGDPSSGVNNTSSLQIPSHTFASAVNSPFMVRLTISNGTSSFTSTNLIYVSACSPILNSETNWRFGQSSNNALDFSTGVPLMSSQSDLQYTEASAVVSNGLGQLLFKSNSNHVSNNNSSFSNFSLTGSTSAHRGVLIIKNPNPSFTNQYYLFTKNGVEQTLRSGLRYSLVDASAPNNVSIAPTNLNIAATVPSSLGYILTPNGGIEGGEGITAISSQTGYWIITTGKKTSGYFLMVFKLDASGLTFISETPTPTTFSHSGLNSLEVSPNGDRVLLILDQSTNTASNQGTYIYDFDKFSGQIVNNPENLNLSTYGASFSPNSNLLYLNSDKGYQINLQDINQNSKRKLFFSPINFSYGDIQRGPDNKLYYIQAGTGTKSLYVIHNPNNLNTLDSPNACSFSKNGPTGTNFLPFTALGLPNMINSKKETAFETNAISSYPTNCYTRRFFPDSYGTSFNWDFGDSASGVNNTFTGTLATHTFSGNGTFVVTLRSSSNVFIAQTTIIIGIPAVTILGSTTACIPGSRITNNSVTLISGQTATWSITGGAGSISGLNNQSDVTINWTTLPGTITLTVTDGSGCTRTTTRNIIDRCIACNCLNSLYYKETPQLDNTYYVRILNSSASCSTVNMRHNFVIGNNIPYTFYGPNDIVYIANGSQTITLTSEALDSNGNVLCSRLVTSQIPATSFKFTKQSLIIENNIYETEEIMDIFPNPSNGEINIRINQFAGKVNLQVIDLNGRVVYSLNNTDFNIEKSINLSQLQKGMYVLKIDGDALQYTKKIILN